MAVKTFELEGIGTVSIHKSRRSKHLRLSVRSDGSIRVSIPLWVTYQAGIEFAKSRQRWLQEQRTVQTLFSNNDRIGKHHRLVFVPGEFSTVRTRVTKTEIFAYYSGRSDSEAVQQAVVKASIRALKQESESLLTERLSELARRHNFQFRSVGIRQLKGRWGSCTTHKDIVLSCFLIQLSWQEIDYVLLHELTHTLHMSHGSEFWDHFVSVLPSAKMIRKQMRQRKPIVFATN